MTVHPAPGLFVKRLTQDDFTGRPCLFLDRDGVQVAETHYLHRVDDVMFIPGVAAAIARANAQGVAVAMVTNQAGIGRGYYDWDGFNSVQSHIFDHCRVNGGHYDIALACAYHGDGIGDYAVEGHFWRKPGPGMLMEAARILGVDLSRSFIVGDSMSDLAAGAAAGLPGGALVLTGHGEREWRENGRAAFNLLASENGFQALLVDDAAQAINGWLDGQ